MRLLVTIGLLILPAIAMHRSDMDFRLACAYALAISAITHWVYARGKRRAEVGAWRVPEARLHLLDLLGGWPGGFLAQRRLRHNCSKGSFQLVFWLIALAWQFAAFDSLQRWEFSKATQSILERASEHRK